MKKVALGLMTFLIVFFCLSLTQAVAEEVVAVQVMPQASAPQAQEAAVATQAPIKTVEEVKLTVKDEAFVPPVWLQDALLSAKSLPVIGPFLVKAMQWLGVIVSLLTALFAFLWSVLRALQLVLDAGKLYEASNKLAALENSKFMYYLKALSAFNAQKKDKPV